jgi:hypothetical protein
MSKDSLPGREWARFRKVMEKGRERAGNFPRHTVLEEQERGFLAQLSLQKPAVFYQMSGANPIALLPLLPLNSIYAMQAGKEV